MNIDINFQYENWYRLSGGFLNALYLWSQIKNERSHNNFTKNAYFIFDYAYIH